ncbi:Polycystic kidney disease 2-like 2 protein [Fukomys damarensis]|uniref:Polycystic kidney disease 2-like 2 protein n=1 Tax=Fukomys damarensis TaxID=885580 RepID=A0A091CW50_FUKDA|nr:Polycystic kidney disease 2-like 2 protein [Fukomys damarensis]
MCAVSYSTCGTAWHCGQMENEVERAKRQLEEFMEGPLLEGLYWDSWYNNQKLYNLRNSSRIHYENILLGVPRVRQLKVRNNTCKVHSSFQALMSECYGKYTSENEDLSDFGIKSGTEWKHTLLLTPTRLGTGDSLVFTKMGDIFSPYQNQNLKPKTSSLTFD